MGKPIAHMAQGLLVLAIPVRRKLSDKKSALEVTKAKVRLQKAVENWKAIDRKWPRCSVNLVHIPSIPGKVWGCYDPTPSKFKDKSRHIYLAAYVRLSFVQGVSIQERTNAFVAFIQLHTKARTLNVDPLPFSQDLDPSLHVTFKYIQPNRTYDLKELIKTFNSI